VRQALGDRAHLRAELDRITRHKVADPAQRLLLCQRRVRAQAPQALEPRPVLERRLELDGMGAVDAVEVRPRVARLLVDRRTRPRAGTAPS